MNRLAGTLLQCHTNSAISKLVISLDNCIVTAVIIDFIHYGDDVIAGAKVDVLFKESETAIAYLLPAGVLSIRNRLPCRVLAVDDDGLIASVKLDFDGSMIESIITSESASELCLRPGKDVFALVKSTEVMVEKGMA